MGFGQSSGVPFWDDVAFPSHCSSALQYHYQIILNIFLVDYELHKGKSCFSQLSLFQCFIHSRCSKCWCMSMSVKCLWIACVCWVLHTLTNTTVPADATYSEERDKLSTKWNLLSFSFSWPPNHSLFDVQPASRSFPWLVLLCSPGHGHMAQK